MMPNAVIASCHLFSPFSGEEATSILRRSGTEIRLFDAGTVIIPRHERVEWIGVVLEGLLAEYGFAADGEIPHALVRYASGGVFGTDACFGEAGTFTKIAADTDSRVLLLPARELMRDPVCGTRFRQAVCRVMAERNIRMALEMGRLPVKSA